MIVKNKLLIILTIVLFGCKPKPEFYINGKPYYKKTYCVKSHIEKEVGINTRFNGIPISDGIFYGESEKIICDEYKTDTIKIKE